MVNISINQILDVWSELEAAYYGKNGFGGDTAEIYMAKFMPYSPDYALATYGNSKVKMVQERAIEVLKEANDSMFNLLAKFKELYDCYIWVENREIDEFEDVSWPQFDHRVYIRIKRK